ncbi:hypothetical protein MYFR107205_15690 [Mycolicibacterium frederiksbergense]
MASPSVSVSLFNTFPKSAVSSVVVYRSSLVCGALLTGVTTIATEALALAMRLEAR